MRLSIAIASAFLFVSPCGAIGLLRDSVQKADQWGDMQQCVNFFTTCGSAVVPTTVAGVGDLFKTCCVDAGHEEATCQNIKDDMLRKHAGRLGSGLCDELQELAKEHNLGESSADQSLHNRRQLREAQNALESLEESAENLDASFQKKGGPDPTPEPTPEPVPEHMQDAVDMCTNSGCDECDQVYANACETSLVQSLQKRRQSREQSGESFDATASKKQGGVETEEEAEEICGNNCKYCKRINELACHGR